MRHEMCPSCRAAEPAERGLAALAVVAESLGGQVHHHHRVSCEACGAWWFDDVVIGGFGFPIPARRDTMLCGCDESLPQYLRGIVMVAAPESECRCTAADVEQHGLPVRLGRQ